MLSNNMSLNHLHNLNFDMWITAGLLNHFNQELHSRVGVEIVICLANFLLKLRYS